MDTATPARTSFIDRWFGLTASGVTVRTEVIAGVTTFLTMVYIVFVNPTKDATEYAPAVVAAITMPLTYSIATGIGLGFITYAACKVVSGRFKEASPAVMILALLFAVKFAVQ
jgi:xanthine/uracil/vitamin C permease (AzgA family)